MRLLVGLGNPGSEYEGTRHNIGWAFVDYLEKHPQVELGKVVLLKPDTFVNKSGIAVKKAKLKYKAKPDHIVVIHDDLDIEFGKFKISFAKDSAGHRGVQSVIDVLKTNKFWRLRIGTANKKLKAMRREGRVADFVLAKFATSERDELNTIIKKAVKQLVDRLAHS